MVRLSGNVTKVGLRGKVVELGLELGIAGRAVNLDDGSVLVTGIGPKTDLEEFLDRINGLQNSMITFHEVDHRFEPLGEKEILELK